MLADFRATVADLLVGYFASNTIDVYPQVPDDVNMLPCIVVGYPEGEPGDEPGVFDRELVVYLLARRVDTWDVEPELVGVADQIWDAFGGTRSVKHAGTYLQITDIAHATVAVAGLDHDAYLFTIESPFVTC